MKAKKDFLYKKRKVAKHRPVEQRIKDYKHVIVLKNEEENIDQGLRCMNCGVPFCNWACPLGNLIPEWNDALSEKNWEKAFNLLASKSNFPEITGRLCPELCEKACVLGVNDDPVTIRENELAIIEMAFKQNYVKPAPPEKRTNKKIAIIGSGPAGLAAADELNKMGHNVTVFEQNDKIGGILRYGIPDFKLEKWILDRRISILENKGIKFKINSKINEKHIKSLVNDYDAVCIAIGTGVPRDLNIQSRNLNGIYFAMDFLFQANKLSSCEKYSMLIDVKDKHVVVLGGGDTGSDCVGTAHRQGAASVVQIELMGQPPKQRTEDMPWPMYPLVFKTSSSHEEGGKREWNVLTKKFIGDGNKLTKLECVKVNVSKDKSPLIQEIKGTEFFIPADVVILALGFTGPEKQGLIKGFGLALTKRGTIKINDKAETSIKGVFAAGDVDRGASLIVWAIAEGKKVAAAINHRLSLKKR